MVLLESVEKPVLVVLLGSAVKLESVEKLESVVLPELVVKLG